MMQGIILNSNLNFLFFSDTDVKGWLYKMEQMLEYYNVASEQRVRMTTCRVPPYYGTVCWFALTEVCHHGGSLKGNYCRCMVGKQ